MIDIKANHLELVKTILAAHVPNAEVRAFGSRVVGNARDYSDLDLVIVGTEKINRKTLYRIEDAFADSDLPFRVDVLDWRRISESFRKVIEPSYEVIQLPQQSRGEATPVVLKDRPQNLLPSN